MGSFQKVTSTSNVILVQKRYHSLKQGCATALNNWEVVRKVGKPHQSHGHTQGKRKWDETKRMVA